MPRRRLRWRRPGGRLPMSVWSSGCRHSTASCHTLWQRSCNTLQPPCPLAQPPARDSRTRPPLPPPARPCSQRPSSRAPGASNGLAAHSGALFGPATPAARLFGPVSAWGGGGRCGRRRHVCDRPCMSNTRICRPLQALRIAEHAGPSDPPACAALPFQSLAGVPVARKFGRGNLGRGAAAPDSSPAATAAPHRRSAALPAAG